ncbi:hypothetical protein [[Limnothrix rosea] IAM M-220]|nr:hypothetical protein [[Limnothrix rosea] IAM M-220]
MKALPENFLREIAAEQNLTEPQIEVFVAQYLGASLNLRRGTGK